MLLTVMQASPEAAFSGEDEPDFLDAWMPDRTSNGAGRKLKYSTAGFVHGGEYEDVRAIWCSHWSNAVQMKLGQRHAPPPSRGNVLIFRTASE
jgi:hypothetical protein